MIQHYIQMEVSVMDVKQVLKVASKVVSVASAIISLGLTVVNKTTSR